MHAYLASCCGGSCPALSYITTCYVDNLTSILPIRMLALSIQQPSRHFSLSHSTVTRNHLEISYSSLVGGLSACLRGICSQLMAIMPPPENYNNTIFPGVGPLASCLDLRVLSTWWHQLLNHNEGPASPSRFLYPEI